MHQLRSRIALVSLLFLAPASFCQNATTTIEASKLQVMQAAYDTVEHEKWNLVGLSVPLGTVRFGIPARMRNNAFECELIVSENGASSTVAATVFDRDSHLNEKERPKIAESILHKVHRRVGSGSGVLKAESVIDIFDWRRQLIRGIPAQAIYDAALRSGRGQWVVATTEPSERRAVFILTRGGTSQDVLLLHVVDLGNTEVRVEIRFRNTVGGDTHMTSSTQAAFARRFVDAALANINGGKAFEGAATE